MPQKRILLISNNDRLALKAADCAAMAGFRVEACGRRLLTALARSRRVEWLHRLPHGDAPDFVALALRRGAGLVFPVDVWGFGVAQEMAALRPDLPVLPAASADTLRLLDDKIAFVRLCEEHGVPVPRSAVVEHGEDAEAALQRIGAPLVLKTPFGESGHGVFHAQTLEDAQRLLATRLADMRPLQLQERLQGPVLGLNLLAHDGEAVAVSAYRKLSGERFRFAPDPAFEAAVAPLMAALRFSGLANFDAIETAAGPVLLECNPRVWYNMQADALMGMNFVAAGERLLAGARGRDPRTATGEWTMPMHLLKRAAVLDAGAWRAGRASWAGALRALSDPLTHLPG